MSTLILVLIGALFVLIPSLVFIAVNLYILDQLNKLQKEIDKLESVIGSDR